MKWGMGNGELGIVIDYSPRPRVPASSRLPHLPHLPHSPAPNTSPTAKRVPLTKSHPDWGRLPAS